jgi:hypothetical protein
VLARLPNAPFTTVNRDLLRARAASILPIGRPATVERPDDSKNLPG